MLGVIFTKSEKEIYTSLLCKSIGIVADSDATESLVTPGYELNYNYV